MQQVYSHIFHTPADGPSFSFARLLTPYPAFTANFINVWNQLRQKIPCNFAANVWSKLFGWI